MGKKIIVAVCVIIVLAFYLLLKGRDVEKLTNHLNHPAIHIIKTEKTTKSYLGGMPPLFDKFKWPSKKGTKLDFLACIDLSEVPKNDSLSWLPASGKLLFFYDTEEQSWGIEPGDRSGWQVVYLSENVETKEDNSHTKTKIIRHNVSFKVINLPPSWETNEIEALKLSNREIDKFIYFREKLYGGLPHHQIGGFADPIQSPDMEKECQEIYDKLFPVNISVGENLKNDVSVKNIPNWHLLLQVDSDDDLKLMWGDVGIIYFWIKHEDVIQKRFDRVWLILQCS